MLQCKQANSRRVRDYDHCEMLEAASRHLCGLADATYDEESRDRYLRLEQLYLALADAEDPEGDHATPYPGDTNTRCLRLIA